MTTIKSYTDLQQSKKLAEILPIESADMYWWYSGKRYYIEAMDDGDFNEKEGHVRAWSLTALLNVLPEGYSTVLTKSFNGKDYYCMIDGKPFETEADNPVDACVAMIEKLNELKML